MVLFPEPFRVVVVAASSCWVFEVLSWGGTSLTAELPLGSALAGLLLQLCAVPASEQPLLLLQSCPQVLTALAPLPQPMGCWRNWLSTPCPCRADGLKWTMTCLPSARGGTR